MTYQRHEVVVITTCNPDAADALIAFRATMPDAIRHLFIGPIWGSNSYQSFALMPDGMSKTRSDNIADEWRRKLTAFLPSLHCDWIHVHMHEDEDYSIDERGRFHPFPPYFLAYGSHRGDEDTGEGEV